MLLPIIAAKTQTSYTFRKALVNLRKYIFDYILNLLDSGWLQTVSLNCLTLEWVRMNSDTCTKICISACLDLAILLSDRRSSFQSSANDKTNKKAPNTNGNKSNARIRDSTKSTVICQDTATKYPIGFFQSKGNLWKWLNEHFRPWIQIFERNNYAYHVRNGKLKASFPESVVK